MIQLPKTDPKLDLILDRTIDVPPELIWMAWTQPEHLKHWFCPKPWMVTQAEVDLRPGGIFKFHMRGPEGEASDHEGCYLEVVPNQKLVWTIALLAGFRPAPVTDFPSFTATLTLIPQAAGTRYIATVCHRDEAARQKHEAMGFNEGWATCLNQLVEYAHASLMK
jgi:uncharacterized protein YndB with AHSA1/START domain